MYNYSKRDIPNTALKVIYTLIFIEVLIKIFSYFSIKSLIISNLYINYKDGFIRRGLFGSLLYIFSKNTLINPFYLQMTTTILVILILIVWFLTKFSKHNLNIYIFFGSFMIVNILAYNMFFFVEVYLFLLSIILFTLLKYFKSSIPKILLANTVLIIGSLIHEAFFLFNFLPTLYFLIDEEYSFFNIKKIASLFPSFVVFLILGLYFNGQFTDENLIIDSWKIFKPSYINEIKSLYWTFNTSDKVLIWRIPIFQKNPINLLGFFMNLVLIFFSFSYYIKSFFFTKWKSFKTVIFLQYLVIILISMIAIDYVRWFWWGNITLLLAIIIYYKRDLKDIYVKHLRVNMILILFIGLPLGGSWSLTQFIWTMPIKHVYDLFIRLI